MAFGTEDYTDLTDLKAMLGITSSADDDALGVAITAASRAVDHATNRQFGLTGSAVPRYYTWKWESVDRRPALAVDDLMTTTGLEVGVDTGDFLYSTALAYGTDFDVWPYNAQADAKPWTHLVLRPGAAAAFPTAARGVEVTGNWGWSTVPTIVVQATLIQAGRFFVRKDALFGVAGSPQTGSEVRLLAALDPDVRVMLASVSRPWGAI